MRIIKEKIKIAILNDIVKKSFGNLVKAVIDIDREIMVIDSELHADQEAYLLENGSKQENLWGINLYPELGKDEWIEFDSMINIRPGMGNLSRSVENEDTREKIINIVNKLVER